MTLTGNLADVPVVTAGFGADGVALADAASPLPPPATSATSTAPRSSRAPTARRTSPSTALRFNVSVTGVTP